MNDILDKYKLVQNILRKRFPKFDKSVITDATQEGYLKYHVQHLTVTNPLQYILLVATNYLKDLLKSSFVRRSVSVHPNIEKPEKPTYDIEKLLSVIDHKLPPDQRDFVNWYWFKIPTDKFKHMKIGSVYTRMIRLKKTLKVLLEKEGIIL